MTHYGIVHLNNCGEECAKAQDFMLKGLCESGIITLTKSRLRDIYKNEQKSTTASTCHFVLHDEKETEDFRKVMRSPELKKDWIRWRTTTRLGQENEFRRWLEKRGVYKDVEH